jgi:hypothetical protein
MLWFKSTFTEQPRDYSRSSQVPYNNKVVMNRATHSILLWSKIVLPFIGAIGNVSKKALIMHIARPVLPIMVKPLIRRTAKRPAKANAIRIAAEDRIALMRFVSFGA